MGFSDRLRALFGLRRADDELFDELADLLVEGDLGASLRTKRPLTTELGLRLPVTAQLTVLAAIIGAVPALVLGTAAAMRRRTSSSNGPAAPVVDAEPTSSWSKATKTGMSATPSSAAVAEAADGPS